MQRDAETCREMQRNEKNEKNAEEYSTAVSAGLGRVAKYM